MVMEDLKFSLRALAAKPLYSAASILVLALGIGTVATAFSLVNGVLLRPLPFSGSERVVEIWRDGPFGSRRVGLSSREFEAVANQSTDFQAVAAERPVRAKCLGGSAPRVLEGAEITDGWLSLLGKRVVEGRPFRPADFRNGSKTVILSHQVWAEDFQKSASAIGTTLYLRGGHPYVVVGVAGKGFSTSYFRSDFWVPASPLSNGGAGEDWSVVLGRMRPGANIRHIEAELATLEGRLAREDPTLDGRTLQAVSLRKVIGENARPMLLLLLGAAGLLFLISCSNAAILSLIRGEQRKTEILLRQALGAPRARIFRLLMSESALIASAGCGIGLLLAAWSAAIVASRASGSLPRAAGVRVDGTVLLATIGVGIVATLIAGALPATRLARHRGRIGEWSSCLHGSPQRQKLLPALIAIEVTLSVVLLTGFGLLSTSLSHLQNVNLGFDPHNVLTFWVHAPGSNEGHFGPFFRQVQERIAGMPGVKAVGVASNGFFAGSTRTVYSLQAKPANPNAMPQIEFRLVSARFLRAIGVPLLRGRYFDDHSASKATAGVMVNAAFERSVAAHIPFFRQRIYLWGRLRPVVGVVGDLRDLTSPAEVRPTVYAPFPAWDDSGMIAVRTTATPSRGIVAAISRQVLSISGDQPLFDVSTAEQVFSLILNPARLRAALVGLFSLLGYIISMLGVYGVTAYTLSQRRQEMGIRMALGATPRITILRCVFLELRLALISTGLGIIASVFTIKAASTALFETRPWDPMVLGAVALLACSTTCVAAIIPAARAVRNDPIASLRCN